MSRRATNPHFYKITARRSPRRSPTTFTWTTTGRPVAPRSATSPRSPRPASARPGRSAARAVPAAAPTPTLLRTPGTRRRIWSSRRGPRGRGAPSARRLSAGATRTSPRSPCGGPAPRSTSRTSARAATAPPCRRSASTRRRGRRRITTVTLCPCNTRIQETPKLLLPEHRLGRMDRRRRRRIPGVRRVLHPRDLLPTDFFHRRLLRIERPLRST